MKVGVKLNQLIKYFTSITLLIGRISIYIRYSFFLPLVTSIGATFSASKYDLQLIIPIFLFGRSLTSFLSGILADKYQSKRIHIIFLCIYCLALFCSSYSSNLWFFLIGIFFQGLSSASPPLFKLIKIQYAQSASSVFSIFTMIATVCWGVSSALSGHFSTISGWRAIFNYIAIINIINLISFIFLNIEHETINDRFVKSFKSMFSLLRNKNFRSCLISCSAINIVMYIFYSLSPYIYMRDFHLTPGSYGLLLFFPLLGLFIGNLFTSFLSKIFDTNSLIFFGFVFSLFISSILIVVFYLYPTAFVLTSLISILFIGVPIVNNLTRMGAMQIMGALAGSASGLLSGFVIITCASLTSASARFDGEIMSFIIFGVLFLRIVIGLSITSKEFI